MRGIIFVICALPVSLLAQTSVITVTYQFTSYGNHRSEQFLKLWNGKSHFQFRQEDEEYTDDRGYTLYHWFKAMDIYTDTRSRQVVWTRLRNDRKTTLISSWPFQDFNWHITSETKEILGYRVQKATAKAYYFEYGPEIMPYREEVIAWFTPDISYSAGPDGYYGLPGLILELYYKYTYDHYIAKKIDLSGKGDPITLPSEGFRITKEQMVFPVKNKIDQNALNQYIKEKKKK